MNDWGFLWLPLAIGFLWLRRAKSFGVRGRTQVEVWNVRMVALLAGLIGVVNAISAVMPSLGYRLALLREYIPIEAAHGARLASAILGFVLLVLAGNLWRRKRLAWFLAMNLLVISAISQLLKGLDYEEAVLAIVGAVWLGSLHAHFHARSDPPSVSRGLRVLLGAILFTLAYGVMGFYLLDRHYSVDFRLLEALKQTVIMFTQFYDPGLQPITRFGRYFANSIYVVAAATVAYALLALLRPVLVRQPATAQERAVARHIVETYGRSSLARFALLPDKSYYFSPGGSLIAYVAKSRIALVLGDPIGPIADVAPAIAGFQQLCARNDWQVAFYQTQPDTLGCYQAAGLNVLCIGQEAIVDLGTFSISGRRNKNLRAAFNRLTREGYQAIVYIPPLSNELLDELRIVSDTWLSMVHGSEQRFSLGWFDDEYIRHSPVMAIRDADGTIVAFANVVPEYQRNEISLDLMRRLPDTESGVMVFMFISFFQWAAVQGYETFNLGLSALAGVGEESSDPAVERALHYIYEHVNQFYNFKGLHSFKEKFQPEWSSRYLIYPGTGRLPAVALALNRATAGDRFWLQYIGDFVQERLRPEARPVPEAQEE